MVIHDTECPHWNQVSLNNPNPPTSPSLPLSPSPSLPLHTILFRTVWSYMTLNVLTETRCHWTNPPTHLPLSPSLSLLLAPSLHHTIWNNMVIHDTECPYWDQVSLNSPNLPTSPSPSLIMIPLPPLHHTVYGHTWHRMSLLKPGVKQPKSTQLSLSHCHNVPIVPFCTILFRTVWSYMTPNVLTETRCH